VLDSREDDHDCLVDALRPDVKPPPTGHCPKQMRVMEFQVCHRERRTRRVVIPGDSVDEPSGAWRIYPGCEVVCGASLAIVLERPADGGECEFVPRDFFPF